MRDKFARQRRLCRILSPGSQGIQQGPPRPVPGLLARLISAAAKHQAVLGPELLLEFQSLKTTFDNARDGQVAAKGDLAQARANVTAARGTMERQRLGANILAIASHHFGQPDQAAIYFNQSLLEDPTRSKEDEAPRLPWRDTRGLGGDSSARVPNSKIPASQ